MPERQRLCRGRCLYHYPDFWLSSSRAYCFIKRLCRKFNKKRVFYGDEITLPYIPEAEEQRCFRLAADNYRRNLRRLSEMAREYKKSIILATVAVNYRDFEPGSALSGKLGSLDTQRFRSYLNRGAGLMQSGEYRLALIEFQKAAAIDPGFASAHFCMARCHEYSGDFQSARREYLEANERDINFLRAKMFVNKVVEEVAENERLPLVRIPEMLEANSGNGLLGYNFFLDYCHFNIAGHRLVAEALAKSIIGQNKSAAACRQENINEASAAYAGYLGLGGGDFFLLDHWLGISYLFKKDNQRFVKENIHSCEDLRAALPADSYSDSQVCALFGNEKYDQGDFKDAARFYTLALKLNPDFVEAYLNAGCAFLRVPGGATRLRGLLAADGNFIDSPKLRREINRLINYSGDITEK